MECLEKQDFLMNTVVEQRIYADKAEEKYQKVLAEIIRLEDMLSYFKENSEITGLNKMAGKQMVKVSPEVILILKAAKEFSMLSNGSFDITLAPVIALYAKSKLLSTLPDKNTITDMLKLVDYHRISIYENNNTAFIEQEGACINLGGIAKGFAADVCIEMYQAMGIQSAFVNFGGNVKTLGKKEDGEDWVIGIQHPEEKRGVAIGAVHISDTSVVTSGGYERFFEVDNKRYHHIIDPLTGCPAESDLKSATVVCQNSMQADALSTASFVMGLEKAIDMINQANDTDAIFVTNNNDIYIGEGLRGKFFLTPNNSDCNCYVC
jgi:thiamine biosynthesis lipoprotein